MGYIFKCRKNVLYRLTIYPLNMISKTIFGEMVLSGPSWPSVLRKISRQASKQLRDTASHRE